MQASAVVQNLAGGVWLVGIGLLLRAERNGLGVLAVVAGLFSLVNAAGGILDVESVNLVGLTGNLLLAPAWAVWLGVDLLRSPAPD